MGSRKDPTSAVLHALRYTSDEVQLGREFATVCQGPAVAGALTADRIGGAI
jgi:hypothetical protein